MYWDSFPEEQEPLKAEIIFSPSQNPIWSRTGDYPFAKGHHLPSGCFFSMDIVLFQPEIPPNTGNIARLCAAMDVDLHLIEPLGFKLEDRYLKRAGLDYWPHVRMKVWPNLEAYLQNAGTGKRLVLTSARRGAPLHHFTFTRNDALVFGRETSGLPPEVLALSDHRVRIPIRNEVRSLNLSTAAGIILFQALASTGLLDETLPS